MVSLLTKLGFSSFSALFNPDDPPVQEVLSSEDANSKVTPTIDKIIEAQAYNFILGTTGGANDPNAVTDGASATEPIDDGDPEYSISEKDLFASMEPYASENPSELDPNVFSGWSQQEKQLYLSAWGVTTAVIGADVNGGANALYVSEDSSGNVSITSLYALALAQANAADATDAGNQDPATKSHYQDLFAAANNETSSAAQTDFTTPPADLDPSVFASWTPKAQGIYLAYYDGIAPAQTVIGSNFGNGANAIVVETTVVSGQPVVASTTSLLTWALQQAASINSPAKLTVPTSSSPSDLGAYGSVAPADLDPNVFIHWTSEQQSEYMNYNGLKTAVIGSNFDGGANAITAVLSQTKTATVYIVNNLQASDLAEMSAVDVLAVAATAEFKNVVGPELGLSADISSATDLINDAINTINGSFTPEYFEITDLQAQSSTTTNYTAAQVAAGDVVIPTASSSSQDGAGGMTSTLVTKDNNVTTEMTVVIDPKSGVSSYYLNQYTKNSDGSVSVSSSLKTGNGQILSSAPTSQSEFSVIGSIVPNSDGATATISMTYNANGVGFTNTGTLTNKPVTVSTAGGDVIVDNMPTADREVYIQELQLLEQQAQDSGVVDQTAIQTKIGAILQRFDQAAVYWSASSATTSPQMSNGQSTGVTTGVDSTDGGASFAKTYQTLIAQENLILQAAQDGESLATDASLQSPDVDGPTAAMIALTASMSSQQAQIDIGTTQLQQIQTLLQDISTLQNLINAAVTSLGSDTTDKTGVGGMTGAATGLSASDLAVVEMLSSNIAALSPILKQYGITPPDITLINADGTLTQYNQSQLNSMGTQLSTLVTELTQQLQQATSTLNQQVQQQNNTYTENSGIAGQMGTIIDTIGTNMD